MGLKYDNFNNIANFLQLFEGGTLHITIFEQMEMFMLENYSPDPWSAVGENICPQYFILLEIVEVKKSVNIKHFYPIFTNHVCVCKIKIKSIQYSMTTVFYVVILKNIFEKIFFRTLSNLYPPENMQKSIKKVPFLAGAF